MEGWIKLHRSTEENWVWKNPKYAVAWIHCLFRANYKDTKVLMNGEFLLVLRGEFITSIGEFGNEVNMSPQEVRTFWKLLEKDSMIVKNSTKQATKITVCNYEEYQDEQQSKQQSSNKPATTEKESKEGKNKKGAQKLPYDSPKFRSVWNEWIEYRKSNNWPRSDTYTQRAFPNLRKLAGEDVSLAIKIVEQSMDQGWQGLFALKGGTNKKSRHRSSGLKYDKPAKEA